MGRHSNELPGRASLTPYRQGEFSHLCGIYAAINAARMILPERAGDRTLWASLFDFATKRLSAQRRLRSSLSGGMSFETWKLLQHAIYEELSERTDIAFHMRPLIRRRSKRQERSIEHIRMAIDAGRVVLCALSGSHDHYTVIAGYTASRWLLHDSHGLRWVDLRSTDIGFPRGARHWMPLDALFVLYRVEAQA